MEHRAGRAGDVPGTATGEREIELAAGFGRNAYGTNQHAADGCAVDATAAVGEPAAGRRVVDAARGAARSAGAFGADAYAAVRPECGRTAGGAGRAEPPRRAAAGEENGRGRVAGAAITAGASCADRSIGGMARCGGGSATREAAANAKSESDGEGGS